MDYLVLYENSNTLFSRKFKEKGIIVKIEPHEKSYESIAFQIIHFIESIIEKISNTLTVSQNKDILYTLKYKSIYFFRYNNLMIQYNRQTNNKNKYFDWHLLKSILTCYYIGIKNKSNTFLHRLDSYNCNIINILKQKKRASIYIDYIRIRECMIM